MNRVAQLEDMLLLVAKALGAELSRQVAFVGGSTTGLLVTDKVTQSAIRYTEDVDLIVNVIGYSQWRRLQQQLQARGFSINPEDDVICRMRLGQLKVDFMPDDASILGFSNRWYAEALAQAKEVTLRDGTCIQLVTPCHFVATKLEAFQGRGDDDPLASHDIEDFLTLVDGREELYAEVRYADPALRAYIAEQTRQLLERSNFDYAVQAAARNGQERESIIFRRLEALSALARL